MPLKPAPFIYTISSTRNIVHGVFILLKRRMASRKRQEAPSQVFIFLLKYLLWFRLPNNIPVNNILWERILRYKIFRIFADFCDKKKEYRAVPRYGTVRRYGTVTIFFQTKKGKKGEFSITVRYGTVLYRTLVSPLSI